MEKYQINLAKYPRVKLGYAYVGQVAQELGRKTGCDILLVYDFHSGELLITAQSIIDILKKMGLDNLTMTVPPNVTIFVNEPEDPRD